MVTNRQIINDFLIAYTKNQLETVQDILDEQCIYQSTNIGTLTGIDNIIQNLRFSNDFDIAHVTTTNRLNYIENNFYTEGLIAHHLVSYEKNNELFPFIFGGKYTFSINTESKKITKINFVLEYQAENTIYVKGLWKLANGFNNYACLKEFNTQLILKNSFKMRDISNLVNLFFWALDTGETDILTTMADASFIIERDKSVGHEKFTSDISNIEQFIEDTNKYFSLNQNSIRINSINDDNDICVYAQHLTPHRLGTKKLNSLTKYHSFFDEDITVLLDRNTLKIKSVKMQKASDVYYNGFSILEY